MNQAAQKGVAEPSLGRNKCGWSRGYGCAGESAWIPPLGWGRGSKQVRVSCDAKAGGALFQQVDLYHFQYNTLPLQMFTQAKDFNLFVFKGKNKALLTIAGRKHMTTSV